MKAVSFVTLCSVMVGGMLFLPSSAESSAAKKPAAHQRSLTVFSPHDVRVIREYYAPRYRNLPPGLQKKLRRTGQLPPGWQKKIEPFPIVLERRLVTLPTGYRRGVIERHAVIFDPRTRVIIDLAPIF